MSLEIELTFNRKDFEEIYFNKNQGLYFRSISNLKALVLFILSVVIFSLILSHNLEDTSGSLMPLFIFGIITLITCGNIIDVTCETWKVRKKVKLYLDNVEKYRRHHISLTNENFKIIQDKEITQEKWTDITSLTVTSTFVHMISKTETYLIPKKSMTELEFSKLKSFLISNVDPKNQH